MKELEDALRQGGEKVTQGRIRVDSKRALSRLRDFRFAEPSHWVLEVARAAALSGAKKLTVRTDADDVELAFDGKPFPADLMKHLLEQALNSGQSHDERRTRLLALGIAGALGMKAAFVSVTSGGIQLTLRDESVDVREADTKSTFIHLHKALGWRVLTGLLRGAPEASALRERAHRFPGKVVLDGKEVTRPSPAARVTRVATGDGFRLEAALPEGDPRAESKLEIDVCGVVVTTRTLTLPGLQLDAWVRADAIRRNASGSDVVDGDSLFDSILTALRRLSIELLTERGPKLASDPKWRDAFCRRLLAKDVKDPRAKAQLELLPLVPGPSGEFSPVADFLKSAREDKRVYVAKHRYPEGSYPTPAALLTGLTHLEGLLPEAKRIDVEPFVRKRSQVAFNRKRHEQQQVEAPRLPERSWVARAPIDATSVTGEVGFERGGHGAFVRVLHHGKLLTAGELTTLAPLRLRAVIDWSRPLGDEFFEGGDDSKLFSRVQKYVEQAASDAICEALPAKDVREHAIDLLQRLVVLEQKPRSELPKALIEAPLFTCFEAPPVSLATLFKEHHWRFVGFPPSDGLLDGSRLLVLDVREREVLNKLDGKKLDNVTNQLVQEATVRARLSGPKRTPVLEGALVKRPLTLAGYEGEVGIPHEPASRLTLTLLKSGVHLETTELTPRYHHAAAVVESERFSPNARWTAVTRDDGFRALVNALTEAQRELLAALVELPREKWSAGGHVFFAAALKKELEGFDLGKLDPLQRQLALAPLFQTGHGRQSLLELQAQLMQSGRLFVLPEPTPVPEGFHVLFEAPAIAAALGAALGTTLEDGARALEVAQLRQVLAALPVHSRQLSAHATFRVELEEGPWSMVAGLARGEDPSAEVTLTIGQRRYHQLSLPDVFLPLELVVENADLEPNARRAVEESLRTALVAAINKAGTRVLAEALKKPQDEHGRRAILLALARTSALPAELVSEVQACPVFPCTDGVMRSAAQLGMQGVSYTLRETEGVLPDKKPIVVAHDRLLQVVLSRWTASVQVDDALVQQRKALADRAKVERHEQIRVSAASPWRQDLSEQDAVGEVAIALQGGGRLELYFEQRPLCVLDDALPPPLTAAVDSPHLTPTADFKGVVHDAQLQQLVELVKQSGERLAARVATEQPPEAWLTAFAQLAFTVAEASAWEWKGQKKSKRNKKKEPAVEHPMLQARVFRMSDGAPASLGELIARQRQGGVEFVTEGGRFLEAGRVAWWPRPGEETAASKLGLTLRDVTEVLRRDESIRRRPRFQGTLSAPIAGAWREPVTGPGLEGELALTALPERQLVIEVLHDRLLLERWETKHPVGGVARVDSSALTPTDDWRGAKRDAAFKALVQATEAALERLLVRRLERDAGEARSWALAALPWRLGTGGSLASVLAGASLLTDVQGKPVTVGAALELARKRGRAPLARRVPEDSQLDTLVLRNDEWNQQVLRALELQFEDVTDDLRRAKDLERSLTARRLQKLTVGEGLVRRKVATAKLTGELALAPSKGKLTLARDGIAVCDLEGEWGHVIGVLDVKELEVDEDWTSATLTSAQHDLVTAEVEGLFAQLIEALPGFSDSEREFAAQAALGFLEDGGLGAATQLDRLRDLHAALADAPLFQHLDGQRLNLRTVAAEVVSRGRVAVLPRGKSVRSGDLLVLVTSRADAPWLDALEPVLGGKTKVHRIEDTAAWEDELREADPQDGTPEHAALRFLRKELRLLRAGALGSLTPDDVEDLKLERRGGKKALRYDRARKLVFLDPGHPDVARTLAEPGTRPERLWVLLTAIFGLVNRELHHVTDEHEAKLLLALAGHLAANPNALSTRRGEGP